MRAKEFIVEYIEQKTEEYHGLHMKLRIVDEYDLTLYALDDWGNEVAHVSMNIGDNDELDPQDLEVDARYRGQGIARIMYDYLTEKGYEIHRSWDQTDAGAHFWEKNRGDNRVWEDEELDEVGDSYYDVSHSYDNTTSLNHRKIQYKTDLPDIRKRSGFEFTTQDGTKYWLNIRKVKGGKTGRMGIDVEFHQQNSEFPWDINGKGNALKVFSTVKNVIAKYISLDPSISLIAFTAKNSEPSRVKLYKMFASQFTKYFPEFSEARVENHRDSTVFKLSKPLQK